MYISYHKHNVQDLYLFKENIHIQNSEVEKMFAKGILQKIFARRTKHI